MAKKYGKLVRDRIPDKIRRNGDTPNVRTLSIREYKSALSDKLVEEAEEVRAATRHRDLVSELADVYEVAWAIMQLNRITAHKVLARVMARRAEDGGFSERVYLKGVQRKKKK